MLRESYLLYFGRVTVLEYQAFEEAVDGTGVPRVDFYCNEATGETWLNEVNPCPGSFGYFLWEAADPPIRFTALLSLLIDEAVARHRERQLPDDPVPAEARLLRRPSA